MKNKQYIEIKKMIEENKKELLIIAGPNRCGKTTEMINLIKELRGNKISTLFFNFELKKEDVLEELETDEETLKKSNVFSGNFNYIEDICLNSVELKKSRNIQLIIIDSITELITKKRYCFDRSDIVSIIIKKLKELSQKLEIPIIVTAPTGSNKSTDSKEKILSYFCKADLAKEFVDEIYIIE